MPLSPFGVDIGSSTGESSFSIAQPGKGITNPKNTSTPSARPQTPSHGGRCSEQARAQRVSDGGKEAGNAILKSQNLALEGNGIAVAFQ